MLTPLKAIYIGFVINTAPILVFFDIKVRDTIIFLWECLKIISFLC